MVSKNQNPQSNNKVKKWIDTIINLPTSMASMPVTYLDSYSIKNEYLCKVKKLLDDEIYGLDSVKERILFLLNNRLTKKDAKGFNLALSGPPGTAKTSIINVLAKVLNLPFFQINTAGIKNSDFLLGHNFTYEGSGPGCIVQALLNIKCKNGIIYFDEFDKISTTDHGLEISHSLLHITDSTQNYKFHDHYIGEQFNIDLSNIWFIYSLNDKNLIDPTLRDRISIVDICGYTKKEKKIIARDHIIPKALRDIGIDIDLVKFDNNALEYLVDISSNSNEKSGVRQLKHLIEEIIMKINFAKTIYYADDNKILPNFYITEFSLPLIVTQKVLIDLKINIQKKDEEAYFKMYS